MNIHDFTDKIKSRRVGALDWAQKRRNMLIFSGIILGCSISSFFIGYVARAETVKLDPVVINCPLNAYAGTPNEASFAVGVDTGNQSLGSLTGSFVASKNGKKYYPLSCPSVQRIKQENKIFFSSEAEAKGAGLEPAAGC